MKKIAFITVGQSPRNDMCDVWEELENCEIIQAGVLDDLSDAYIDKKLAPVNGDAVLVTKKQNGNTVIISEKYISPLIDKCVKYVEEKEADIIVLLCTGETVRISSSKIVLHMNDVVTNYVLATGLKKRIGIVIPDERQRDIMENRWEKKGINVRSFVANPYGNAEEHKLMAEKIKNESLAMLILDCLGFKEEHAKIYSDKLGIPVILPRRVLVMLLKTLL